MTVFSVTHVYCAFVDMDNATIKLICTVLRRYGVPESSVEVVQVIYMDPVIRVQTASGFISEGGLHQETAWRRQINEATISR